MSLQQIALPPMHYHALHERFDSWEDASHIYLVQQLCGGGELPDWLNRLGFSFL